MNLVKKAIFRLYLGYTSNFPSPIGKGFLGRCVRLLGFADYEIGGVRFELNPCAWIDRDVISGISHDPFVTDMIAEKLSNGGTFLDIGANIGVFSLSAAKYPNVFVYAFEPSPRELVRLYRNIASNSLANVVVYPLALGGTHGWMSLFLGGYQNPGTNSMVAINGDNQSRDSTLCRCARFDGLLAANVVEEITLVKIDVEGFEMEVLRGMAVSIASMEKATFVVEITRSLLGKAGSSVEELYSFFCERGFMPLTGVQSHDQWNEAFVKKT